MLILLISSGNFSVVYRGIRKKDNQNVAIKELDKVEDDDVSIEVSILGEITHPNITNIQEVFESSTQIFIVLDLYFCPSSD